MDKLQLKGLCYNFDDKYFPENKCKEDNIFMAISKDVFEEEVDSSSVPELPPLEDLPPSFVLPIVEPLISLNALTSFSTPQTLKLIGYIKNHKIIILVDNGSTNNFIHHRISQEFDCYIHPINNFQIMISNGGSMKFGGCC